jgi:hypothetical protein
VRGSTLLRKLDCSLELATTTLDVASSPIGVALVGVPKASARDRLAGARRVQASGRYS